jgi:Ser/Thr protein kinase RdoA (MazF antagonist)
LAYFFQVGALTGILHHFFQQGYTPSILDRHVRDITHITQEANSLFDPSVAFAKMEKRYRACIERFLDAHHQTFSTIFNRCGHCLIHGDIIQKNIIVLDDRLGLIDFDECAFAPPIFEIATTFKHWRDHLGWEDMVGSYLRGYSEWVDCSEELRTYARDILSDGFLSC